MKNRIIILGMLFCFGGALQAQSQSPEASPVKSRKMKVVELKEIPANATLERVELKGTPASASLEVLELKEQSLAQASAPKACCASKSESSAEKTKETKGSSCCSAQKPETSGDQPKAQSAGCASSQKAKSCCSAKSEAKKD